MYQIENVCDVMIIKCVHKLTNFLKMPEAGGDDYDLELYGHRALRP